ncbi:MAG TPA: hypothetical protein VF832_16680 [Longimicrobiales bacterium]
MALNGLTGVGLGGAQGLPTRPLRTGAAPQQRPAESAKATSRAQAPANAVPAEAPAGTDPALWAVLTGEERAYFARFQALGPLTYAPRTPAPTQAIPRGGRLDVTA